jgi:hypothetical protein
LNRTSSGATLLRGNPWISWRLREARIPQRDDATSARHTIAAHKKTCARVFCRGLAHRCGARLFDGRRREDARSAAGSLALQENEDNFINVFPSRNKSACGKRSRGTQYNGESCS